MMLMFQRRMPLVRSSVVPWSAYHHGYHHDVTLVCSDTTVTTHSLVMAAVSPFIKGLMSELTIEDGVTIILPDVTGHQASSFLSALHTKDLTPASDQLSSVRLMSSLLGVNLLSKLQHLDVVQPFINCHLCQITVQKNQMRRHMKTFRAGK